MYFLGNGACVTVVDLMVVQATLISFLECNFIHFMKGTGRLALKVIPVPLYFWYRSYHKLVIYIEIGLARNKTF